MRPHVLGSGSIQWSRTGAQPVVSVRNQPEAHFCLSPSLSLKKIWVVLQAELPVSSLDLRRMQMQTLCNMSEPLQSCGMRIGGMHHCTCRFEQLSTPSHCKRPASLHYVHHSPKAAQPAAHLLFACVAWHAQCVPVTHESSTSAIHSMSPQQTVRCSTADAR
jgi:hypothetical protein